MTATTLDEELEELSVLNPKLIKVDTVGVDQPVLEGAYKLLRDSAVPCCYGGIASICFGKDGILD